MKSSKSRLPVLIGVSVVLCIIVSALSMVVISSADRSMMGDKINENKASMQQTTANVQKDITAKLDFIKSMAEAVSGNAPDFESVISHHRNDLKSYADNGGFATVLISDTEGNAYASKGDPVNISGTSYFKTAVAGGSGISDRITSHVDVGSDYAVAYYAPISSDNNTLGVMIGLVPAEIDMTAYTDSAPDLLSGMYILNSRGNLVMSSHSDGKKSFYDYVKDSKYADGTSGDYRELESEQHTPDSSSADGKKQDVIRPANKVTDFYAGDITNSKGFLGWLSNHDNTSNIYLKKNLIQNGWTLFYVRSVEMSESTVSFIIISRVLMFSIVILFLFAMIIMLWLQWRDSKKITELAYKDEVTGRANWQKFEITCNNRLNNKSWWTTNYAALSININRFAMFNDYYGHEAGDRILKYIAETLDLMSSAKEMCARRSADKFVVMWSYTDKQQLVDRINDFFDLLKDAPKGENLLFVSVGVYLIDKGDTDIVKAIDLANLAEQNIDNPKSNTITFFDEEVRAAKKEETDLENLMHLALENDEFKLYIQPKHRVKDGALGGAEALVRWVNPEKGFISPGKFIPLFEKNGFVEDVDNYILEQLCKFQQKRLKHKKSIVPISVNVSRVQLSNPNLAQEICAMVDKYSVPHKYIDLELTESACFDDLDVLINTINTLREMGFPVSMDDFGSGYSSLNLLKELPFDTLKIDGEFFRNVTDVGRANIVVKNIINLAKSLNMTIVAEGIETDEQVNFLRTTECDLIQGYYYSKPISAEDFEAYMSKNKIR